MTVPARILLIEDNPANLELMSYLLRAFGYHPRQSVDGAEGLAEIHRHPPDLIICDVQLPVVDGFEVVHQLKSNPAFRAIPIVAVTALAMVGDRERVLAARFDGCLTKPINPETFVSQMEEYLPIGLRANAPACTGEGIPPISLRVGGQAGGAGHGDHPDSR